MNDDENTVIIDVKPRRPDAKMVLQNTAARPAKVDIAKKGLSGVFNRPIPSHMQQVALNHG